MPRIFVAIRLPAQLASSISAALPADLPGLRRVHPELLHLTLAFIGGIPEERVAAVSAAVRAAAGGAGAFEVRCEGLGRFPRHRRIETVWVGIGGDTAALSGVVERIRAELARRDLPVDPKPFRPHLTLGRVRRSATDDEAQAIASAVARAGAATGAASFRAETLEVVESFLSPKGPRYSSRATISLA